MTRTNDGVQSRTAHMNSPEADTNWNRGLPLDKGRPSVRLLRPSDPNNDPGYRGSLDAIVALKESDSQLFPASPGTTLVKEGAQRPFPPQVPLSNVGHECFGMGIDLQSISVPTMHRPVTSQDAALSYQPFIRTATDCTTWGEGTNPLTVETRPNIATTVHLMTAAEFMATGKYF